MKQLKKTLAIVLTLAMVITWLPPVTAKAEGMTLTDLPSVFQAETTEPNGQSTPTPGETEPEGEINPQGDAAGVTSQSQTDAQTTEEQGWDWYVDGTVLTISGEGAMNDYSLQDAAPWDPSITKVVITSGITTIGAYAFYGCSNLTEIVIPDTVQSIGKYAFYNCAALTEVHIPDGVKEIAANTFFGCASLQEMIVPDSVQTIGAGAFSGCGGLVSMTIPFVGGSKKTEEDSAQYPFGYIFGETQYAGGALTEQTYRDGLSTLTKKFYIPSSLRTVTVTGGEIPQGAFMNCVYLESVKLDELKKIGAKAFSGCTGLKEIEIPDGITYFGTYAFENCQKLEEIYIPDSVTYIGSYAFTGCTMLIKTTYGYGSRLSYVGSGDNRYMVLVSAVSTSYTSGISAFQVENGTKFILGHAFKNKLDATEIIIPDGVTFIGEYAFAGAEKAETVTIPGSVKYIDNYAFSECYALKSIDIPQGVEYIGGWAFLYCTAMEKATIAGSVKEIGRFAFSRCGALKEVTLGEGLEKIGNTAFFYCTALTEIVIPESVTYIGDCAFQDCSELKKVSIPNSVEYFGASVFARCTKIQYRYSYGSAIYLGNESNPYLYLLDITYHNLTSFTFREDTKYIGPNAFEGCTKLTSLTIPQGITNIEKGAFKGCVGLKSITIADSVSHIGDGAFSGCSSLESMELPMTSGIMGSLFGTESYTGGVKISQGSEAYYIPSTLKYVTMTGGGLSGSAFSGMSSLKTVTLPADLKAIPERAFRGCTGLTAIEIPAGVTSIGSLAFSDCSSLTSLVIPDSVEEIGDQALRECTKLSTLTIPFVGDKRHKETDYDQYSFGYLFGITSSVIETYTEQTYAHSAPGSLYTTAKFYIPPSLKYVTVTDGDIPYGAFMNCKNLISVKLGNATYIGTNAFKNCAALQTLTLSDELRKISDTAFTGCTALTGTTYGNGLYLGSNENPYLVLYNTTSDTISSIEIHSQTKIIAGYALGGCKNLTSITLPAGILFVGMSAFTNCTALTRVNITDLSAWCSIDFANADANPLNLGGKLYLNGTQITALTIPDDVAFIKPYAFFGCGGITSLQLPQGLRRIGASAFSGLKITSLSIPKNVTAIETNAFKGCTALREVVIPRNVKKIGLGAFAGCSGLQSITVPFVGGAAVTGKDKYQYPFGYIFGSASYTGGTSTKQTYYGDNTSSTTSSTYYVPTSLKTVTVTGGEILRGAFSNCNNLTKVVLEEGIKEIGVSAFNGCKALKEIYLPNSVTQISSSAFSNCTALSAITIPESVTTIGPYAFEGCTGLISITIPGSITKIDSYAFKGCTGLKTVTALEGLQTVGGCAFENCTKLTDVTLPDSVTSIGGGAFYKCTSLLHVNIPNGVTQIEGSTFYQCSSLKSVTIPDSVKTIGNYAFYECTSLQEVHIPDSVTSIGKYAFMGSDQIHTVTIGNGVKTIGELAFGGCTSLKNLTIGNGVKTIENKAFSSCTALTEITIPNSVTKMETAILYNCDNLQKITVPFIGESRKTDSSTNQYPLGYFFGSSSSSSSYTTTQSYYVSGSTGYTTAYYWIPSKLKTVEVTDGNLLYGAFYGCKYLTHIILGPGVLNVNTGAFTNASALESVEASPDNPNYTSEYRILYNKDKTKVIWTPPNHAFILTVNFLYPNGTAAFNTVVQRKKAGVAYSVAVPELLGYSTWLDKVSGTMPAADVTVDVIYYENEKLIGGQCTDTLNWTLYADGMLVFRGTGDIPDYPDGAPWAAYAENIKMVYLDPRVTRIGDRAFAACSNLTFIEYGYSVKSIGAYAFAGCSGLTSFKLPDSVTVIAEGAFQGCTGLKTVVVPDTITTISGSAFQGCSELVQVTIGGAVTEIGDNAFADCGKLTQVYFRGKPVTLGSNALGATDGKFVYYYSTVKGWDEVIIDGRWNGYLAVPYNAIAQENFDGTNVYIIKVVDKHNTPLQNAVVNLGGNIKSTNADGMVYYTKPTEAKSLNISCSNHITFEDGAFAATDTQVMDIIELSDKPSTVQGVRLDNKSIATSVVTIDCAESKNVKIVVNGYSKYTIAKYELYQGERLISTMVTDQETCTFTVNTTSFEEGQTVLVRMHTADGNTVATALNIDVIKLAKINEEQFIQEVSNVDLNFAIGDLGAMDLELPFKFHGLEELHIYTEGRSIFVAIGINPGDVFDKKIDKKEIMKKMDDTWGKKGSGSVETGVEAKIAGYIEIEYLGNNEYYIKSSYVKMGVELKVEAEASASFYGIVGVYFKVYATAEGGLELRISRFEPERGFQFDDVAIYLGGSLGAEGGAYLLWRAGQAGIYGELQYGFTLGIIPTFEFTEVYISGEVGVRWSLLWGVVSDSYVIASGDIYRWPEEKTKLRRMLYSMQRDPNSYTLNDRGYLENRSPWLTEGEYLQKHIYDNVAPQIVTCGDTVMMLWLDDNSQRSSMNFQTLYYSLYENGKWSAPVAVDDNGTFDCEFDVCVADGKIYVIYTEMGNQQSDVATLDITDANALESFVNGVEVNVIVYEKGAFGKPVQLTDNEICEQLPQIDNAGGVLTATWLESNETGLLEEATDNAIRSATLGENGWSEKVDVATGQNIVSDLVAVSLGGKTYTAYIVDADGSQETNEDQTLILRTQEGEAIHLDSGLIMEVSNAYIKDTPVLLWNNNGKPYMVASADQTPVCLMPENAKYGMDFQIVPLPKEQNLMFFVASNYDAEGNAVDGTDVYCAYVDLNGCLTASVRMTETEGDISKYAVSYRDEKILAVYTETIANMENGEVQTVSHLRNAALEFYTDLIVGGVDFSTILVQPGTQLEVELTLRNGGTNAIDGIRVNLLDNAGKLLYTAEQAVTLPSGASQTSKVTLVLPQTIAKEAYSLEVLPQYGMAEAVDARPEDNKKDLALAYADLQIEAEQKIIGEKNYISIAVANGGNVSAGALLQVYAGERLLSELQTGEIAPGQVQQYMVDINAMTTSEDKLVTCTLTADFYDYCTFNDSDAVALLHIEDSYFATDPEQVIHNPELLSNTGRYDKYAPQAVVIEITEEGKYFTGIEGLTEGTHYVVEKNKITLQDSYLSTLEPKTHSFRLVFDFGYEQPASREFALTVEDTTPVTLSGSVSIRGDVAVDRTVSADLSGLETGVGNLLYCWSIDGTVVSTEASYTVKMADYGKVLTLTVTGKNGYTGSLTASATVGLYQPSAPVKPVLSKVESDRITVVKVAGLEYSLDGATWQEESTFAGLQPNKQYTIYARVKSTSTSLSSAVSDGVTATTLKLTVQAPAAPQVASKTQTQIVLVGDSAMEYRMEGGQWTTDPVFSGLKDNTTYVFYQRYKETDTQYASPESALTAVTTPEIVVLRSIAVTTLPTKLSYLEATEELDVSGGKLTLSYSDGTTEVVELTKQMVSGFDNTVFGKQTLRVTYEGKTTTFTVEIVPLDHTVVFKNWDGTVLSTQIYHKGDIVTAPSAPTKASDKTYSYIFDGWDKDVVVCRGDAEYTATFKAVYIDYAVIFRDEDGTELSRKTYHYGDAVTAPAAPSKAADKVYTYTFDGWDQEVVACKGNVTYTATYKAVYIDYIVIFRDEDGTELSRKTYHYGDTVTAPAAPVKAADNTYTYNFAGWGNAVVPCQGNAEYKAVFVPVYIDYTVIFQLEDGTVLSTKTYHYGDAVELPEDPAAPENHTFLGWDAEVTACQGDATYTAVFKKLYTPGDLDGVEGVTDADAVYLLYHTFLPDLYPVDQECDFNGDGEVNDSDAVHLLYYTFLPDLYPLH